MLSMISLCVIAALKSNYSTRSISTLLNRIQSGAGVKYFCQNRSRSRIRNQAIWNRDGIEVKTFRFQFRTGAGPGVDIFK